ncbi:MAG: hypothetical protein JW984_16645 [Deltaproteobacteria bacterium]|uniref:CGNR zinc finger domain-containing protein n=1 Tax=Candidatus Zymogenus saltonus TaxID=2844893 RepID=A0A9D8KJY9_9DELT|nr:hypothetical protein [Candidatus Zymogenus saltonus]
MTKEEKEFLEKYMVLENPGPEGKKFMEYFHNAPDQIKNKIMNYISKSRELTDERREEILSSKKRRIIVKNKTTNRELKPETQYFIAKMNSAQDDGSKRKIFDILYKISEANEYFNSLENKNIFDPNLLTKLKEIEKIVNDSAGELQRKPKLVRSIQPGDHPKSYYVFESTEPSDHKRKMYFLFLEFISTKDLMLINKCENEDCNNLFFDITNKAKSCSEYCRKHKHYKKVK